MDKIFTKAILSQLEYHNRQISKMEEMIGNDPVWSEPTPITERQIGISGKLGVYRIIYKPTMETVSIGQGHVSTRKARHLSVFRNGGKDVVSSSGATSGSQTAQKMYKFDSNLDNWLFSWCDVGDKTVSSSYEHLLQLNEEPLFNDLKMAGNN